MQWRKGSKMSENSDDVRSKLPVELKINGKDVKARPGQTILEVVREQGLDEIPTLCHDPKLEPYGSCFLCVVEVKGARGLLPSCTTRIRDGMEVTTYNERIRLARKTALELLLSDHYADCICPGQMACPASVDVQGYVALARLGYYEDALRLIKERNPLPVVCGRVCVRKCELNCRRNDVDEPVGINYVKRYVAEHAKHDLIRPELKPETGKRVAVVGGGPAGLTCAYFLALSGHSVEIFEAMPRLGGMLRYGIPEYRLPKAEMDKEIDEILALGVEVALEKKLGKDFTLESLHTKDKFDAVFLAMGAPLGRKMGVPGEDAEGIESALDFLRDTELKGQRKLHGKVVVVGGGNSAVDAARTAVRCGADEVTILYRRTRKEMPAHHEEVDAAEKEGIRLEMLAAPVEVIANNNHMEGLRCIRMELGEPDESGRRRPVPIKGSEYDYPCDFVFSAIGQGTDPEPVKNEPESSRPALSRRDTLVVDEATMATNVPGVFAGGDVVSGPAVVIDAIAHGRCAALSIDEFLRNGRVKKHKATFVSRRDAFGPIPERMYDDVPHSKRHHMPEREGDERIRDFKEVELGLSEPDMSEEADRCMECGCKAQFDCALRKYATEYDVDIMRLAGAVRRHKVDSSHPLITLDPNKCILCARCVRTCGDILDLSVLGFVGRGFNTVVKPALGRPLSESPCIACGACIETCPTGALTAKLPYGRQGPWESVRFPSVCGFCSVGCPLDLNVVTDGILWATSPENSRPGEGDLCFRGRFGTGLIQCGERIQKPLIRKNNELVQADWEEAIKKAAQILKEARDKNGPDSVAVLGAARMTMEECYLAARLARAALHTDQIGSFGQIRRRGPRHDLDEIIGETASTCFREDIYSADVVLLAGADPSRTHPVITFMVRRAARKGARVVVINSSNIDLVRSSRMWLDPRRGTAGILLAGVLRRIIESGKISREFLEDKNGELESLKESLAEATMDEVTRAAGVEAAKIEELADMLGSAKRVVAIYDLDDTIERSTDDLAILAQILLLTDHLNRPETGLLLLQADCNSEGARLAGMRQGELPGAHSLRDDVFRRKVANCWKTDLDGLVSGNRETLYERVSSGKSSGISSALFLLEDPLGDPEANRMLGELSALVVVDHFLTETARAAHVVLPASTLAETNGTVISADRRVRACTRVNTPPGGLTTAEVFCNLSDALGHHIPSADPDHVREELSSLAGIAQAELEKARKEGGAWPTRVEIPRVQHLKKVKLDSMTTPPIRYPYATLELYIQRRLSQLGMLFPT
jgi:formate dehydrogenase major subunit